MPFTADTDGFCDRFYDHWHSKKDAVVGWPHFGSWSHDTAGLAWSITTGHIEFVELMQFREYRAKEYHEYLNLGFKIAAAAGSDFAWGSTIGETRVYVYTGAPLAIDKWFANLKKGHSFATNGPVLELTVDGKIPGSEVHLPSAGSVKVLARALGHPKVALPRVLTIEGNDGVIEQIEHPEGRSELTLEFELPVEKSQWLVAHTDGTNGSAAHTSPVYVIVAGQPFWSPERGPAIIDSRLAMIREVEREYSGGTDGRSRGMVERMRRAIQFYDDLKRRIEQSQKD